MVREDKATNWPWIRIHDPNDPPGCWAIASFNCDHGHWSLVTSSIYTAIL